jgi:hypothetical protein
MGTSSEFGSLSATGSLADREPLRGARPRLAWAVVVVAVGLVGAALWLRTRDISPSGPAAQALPVVTSPPLEAPSGGSVRSASSRVSAIADPGDDAALRAAGRENVAPPAVALSTQQQALRPAAPAVSGSNVRVAATSRRAPEGSEKKTKSRAPARKASPAPAVVARIEREPVEVEAAGEEPEAASVSPPATSPAPAVRRTESARDEDPWNPSSFGERR